MRVSALSSRQVLSFTARVGAEKPFSSSLCTPGQTLVSGSDADPNDLTLVAVKTESFPTLACAKLDGRAADARQTST